ncbi:33024_t:CDS:2, partial [Gigaspora margarita]
IQQKNSCKELLIPEEKILIEEKSEVNFDSSNTKKKTDNRIRVTEMTLNESEIEVLTKDNLEEAEKKIVLLYAECRCLDYGVEDTKKIISIFNKKKKFFKNKTNRSIEPILEEILVTKTNLNIESKDKIVINSSYNNIKLDLQTRLTL